VNICATSKTLDNVSLKITRETASAGKPQKSLYVRLKKVGWVDTTKIRINI